jgi:hypothetical protein
MTIYEQILAGLQTKFTGADNATLNRIATKKAEGVTDESQVKAIVDGVNFTDVLTNYGDARADTAAKTFKETYEKKYGIKDGKPIEQKPVDIPPTPPTPPVPTNAADFAKLMQEGIAAAMKPITDKLAVLENEKSASEFSTRVSEAAKKYGISDNLVSKLNVPQDADLDKFMQETKQSLSDAGFQEVKAPESAEQQIKTEAESIADQINKGTDDLIKSKN